MFLVSPGVWRARVLCPQIQCDRTPRDKHLALSCRQRLKHILVAWEQRAVLSKLDPQGAVFEEPVVVLVFHAAIHDNGTGSRRRRCHVPGKNLTQATYDNNEEI